jgi:hypothetical protein
VVEAGKEVGAVGQLFYFAALLTLMKVEMEGKEEINMKCLPCAQWVGVGRSDVLTSLLFLWDRDRAVEACKEMRM